MAVGEHYNHSTRLLLDPAYGADEPGLRVLYDKPRVGGYLGEAFAHRPTGQDVRSVTVHPGILLSALLGAVPRRAA